MKGRTRFARHTRRSGALAVAFALTLVAAPGACLAAISLDRADFVSVRRLHD